MANKAELEAQVADLETKIAALKQENDQLKSGTPVVAANDERVSTLTADLESEKTVVGQLKVELKSAQDEIKSLSAELSAAKKDSDKKLLTDITEILMEVVGDSGLSEGGVDVVRRLVDEHKKTKLVKYSEYEVVSVPERAVDLVNNWRLKYVQDDDLVALVRKSS